MKKKIHNFTSTVVLADGRVFTEKEWFKNPPIFTYEKNKDLIDEYARQVDPNYRAIEKAKRHFERTEVRRKELEEESMRIQAELLTI